jgi:ribosome-binding protein aMBF1 (putative translation factor)
VFAIPETVYSVLAYCAKAMDCNSAETESRLSAAAMLVRIMPSLHSKAASYCFAWRANEERERLANSYASFSLAARETSGLNQTQLGKAVGRSQSFVSNYERGQSASPSFPI